jgi:hypothetical protein
MDPKGNNPKRNSSVPYTNPARNALSVNGATSISGKTPTRKIAIAQSRESMTAGDAPTPIPVTAKNRPVRKSSDAYAYAPFNDVDAGGTGAPLPANRDNIANPKGVD